MDRMASEEAEQAVLGGIMLTNGKAIADVQDILFIDDFYFHDHQEIYKVLCDLDQQNVPLDPVTVSEKATSMNLGKLAELVATTPSAANIRSYANIVKDRSIRRSLNAAALAVQDIAASSENIETVLNQAQSTIMGVGNDEHGAGPREVNHWIPNWIDRLDMMSHSEEKVAGITTGFMDLDKKINGLQKGNLIVIAGRPSMGKTALAMNIVRHVTMDKMLPALVFSLEMAGSEMVTRMVSQVGRVPMERLMSGDLDDDTWKKTNEALSKLTTLERLRIDESASLMLPQIRSRSRRVRTKHGEIGLIVVDYLQLMESDSKGDHRAQQISDITRGLKGLAKELDVPVLVLSQLNRDVEKRDNRRPRLSDLKESGAIEQDADVVLFIYRDVVYNENTIYPRIAEIMVAKQRNGPTGTVLMNYFGEYTQFANIDGESQQNFWESKNNKRKVRPTTGFQDTEF